MASTSRKTPPPFPEELVALGLRTGLVFEVDSKGRARAVGVDPATLVGPPRLPEPRHAGEKVVRDALREALAGRALRRLGVPARDDDASTKGIRDLLISKGMPADQVASFFESAVRGAIEAPMHPRAAQLWEEQFYPAWCEAIRWDGTLRAVAAPSFARLVLAASGRGPSVSVARQAKRWGRAPFAGWRRVSAPHSWCQSMFAARTAELLLLARGHREATAAVWIGALFAYTPAAGPGMRHTLETFPWVVEELLRSELGLASFWPPESGPRLPVAPGFLADAPRWDRPESVVHLAADVARRALATFRLVEIVAPEATPKST
jgi:hypothetical protein